MSGDEAAPRRKKVRRFTAEPQQVSESSLVGVFELPHGAGRPAVKPPGKSSAPPAEGPGAGLPGAAKDEPVLGQRAAEDDPRAWGDGEDDLGEWLKSQRPPHWD